VQKAVALGWSQLWGDDVEENTVGKSLLELLRDVAVDPAEQAALQEAGVIPYLARHGYEDVDLEDLREATGLVADTLPPDVAQTLAFDGPELIDPDQPLPPNPAKAAPVEDVTPSASVNAASADAREAGAHGRGDSTTADDTPSVVAQDDRLAFGAGADTAVTPEDIGAGTPEELDDSEGGADATPGDASSLHGPQAEDEMVDASEGADPVDTFADGLGEDPGDGGSDEPATLDDIGSF
jgi:hypothetical protein